jgi:hypothetical protein
MSAQDDFNRDRLADNVAMLELLVQKNIFTVEEFQNMKVRYAAMIDQLIAKNMGEYRATPEGKAMEKLKQVYGDLLGPKFMGDE